MSMKNPPHPGKVVRVSCLEPLGLNVTEGAKVLGVSRQALSNLVNCRARMSTDMAVRLAKAFGSTTETWIRLQAAYIHPSREGSKNHPLLGGVARRAGVG